jgi:hypothetical protein
MKRLTLIFLLLCVCAVPCISQDINHWQGMAQVRIINGPVTSYAVDYTLDLNTGKLTVELFSLGDPQWIPWIDASGATVEIGVDNGVKITTKYYVVMLIPSSFVLQNLLTQNPSVMNFTKNGTIHPYYPFACGGDNGFISGEVPCTASGAIELQ